MIIRLNFSFWALLASWILLQVPVTSYRYMSNPILVRKGDVDRPRVNFPSLGGLLTNRPSLFLRTSPASMTQDATVDVNKANKPYSFVQDEMRPYAMKLHTRDQAPKEGQQKAQTPFTKWQPSRANYLQFLVDSLEVYQTLDEITQKYDVLTPLRVTGLERSQALKEDIAWMLQYDSTLSSPQVSSAAKEYSTFLNRIVAESMPKFICHYYNHYFAHTAGGRMIGAKMAELLLESKVLKFYQWDGDVKALLEETRNKIDQIASQWGAEEKQSCLEETLATFHYGGSLMSSMKPPSS